MLTAGLNVVAMLLNILKVLDQAHLRWWRGVRVCATWSACVCVCVCGWRREGEGAVVALLCNRQQHSSILEYTLPGITHTGVLVTLRSLGLNFEFCALFPTAA